MQTTDQERKSSHWFLILACLIAAILVLILVYDRISQSGAPAEKNSAERPQRAVPQKPPAGGITDKPGAEAPAVLPPLPATVSSSAPAGQASAIAIKGVVLNVVNRAPVEGARVRVYASSSPPRVVDRTTNAVGAFLVEAPPAIRYGVKVEADGYRPYEDNSFAITRPSYDLQILLTPTAPLRGRVVDIQAGGIADALVTVRRENEHSGSMAAVTTDQSGIFAFSDIPRSGRYAVEAYHPGYDTLGMVNVAMPSENEVILRMRPTRTAGALSGTVTDSARQPVASARLTLIDPADGRMVSRVQTDRQGNYRFSRMREGYYMVRCSADGYSEGRSNQSAVAVYSNKEARLDFSLASGQQIRGTVVNQKGEPVMQATLSFNADERQRSSPAQSASSDDGGRFQVSGLQDTQYLVTVRHQDFLDLVTRLRPSNQMQTLALDPGISLRGTVSNAQGAAVEKFTLIFLSTSSRNSRSYSLTTSDGQFEVRGLPRDTYMVRLMTGNSSYAGQLELQTPTEVLIVLDAPRGGRGTNSLNFLKAK